MPTSTTTNIKTGLMYLFFALAFFFIVFIVKIPVICNGCDPLEGIWYRCIRGTGIGTTTCDIASGTAISFSVDLSELTSIIQNSGLISLPREWIQTLSSVWLSIRSFGQSLVDQTLSLYGYIKEQFGVIIKDYIIGYPKAGYDAFRDNVIVPIISGITNYIVNPVKSLITNIIDFKNTAMSVFNSVVSTVRGVGGTVYDYTYGFLVDGFDQVPYGLVLFIEGIQDILNYLKTGIISGANTGLGYIKEVLKLISDGILGFGKLAVGGTQTAVNEFVNALEIPINFMITNVVNGVVGGLNDLRTYDLASPVRGGINGFVSLINIAYNSVIMPIVNPLIDVASTIQDGVVSAVNSMGDADLTSWIPAIKIASINLKVPSFKPFSFVPKISATPISRLTGSFVREVTTNDIGAVTLSSLYSPFEPVDEINIEVDDFSTDAINKISGWQATARADIDSASITEPADLFWAGTRNASPPTGDVCTVIASTYPLETDEDGLPTKTYANTPNAFIYDQFNTGTCLYSSANSVDNRYIGTSSCSDVCYNDSKLSFDTNDVSGTNCDRQFPIYGSPEQNSIPKMVTPNGLTYYLYRGMPMIYFAPSLYKVNITVNTQSFVMINGQRNYAVNEGAMITIPDINKPDYVKVQNAGYKNIRTGKYYILEKDISSAGSIKAWEYFVNVLTNDNTSCNLEYLLTESPEALGIQSSQTEQGLTVYYLNEQPYIYLNPKLYRINLTTLTPVSQEQLSSSSSAYSFAIPYTDDKSGQIAIRYVQTGYVFDINDKVRLPTQSVNNILVSLTPEQSGFTSRTLGTLFYYVNSNGKAYAYDKGSGQMYALNLNNLDFITGTPESNGYTKRSFGFEKNGYYRTFAVTEQSQFYVVLRKKGYQINIGQRVALPYTFTDNIVTYKTPSESGYVLQPIDVNGLIYYRKDNINYVYDQKGNGMVPLTSMTPSETIFGQPEDAGYTTRLFGFEKNSQTYYFTTEQRFLIQYFSKSLFVPRCGCTSSVIVTKTCKDYCASKYDSSKSQYGCSDSLTAANTGGFTCSDSRVTDFSKCACTEQGPVNIIVKPMQKYNPFRLLQQGISAGVGELTNLVKYSIQSFLTPVWNAIKSIFQFIVSMIVTIVQFIYNFLFSGESSPIWMQIKNFAGSLTTGFKQYVIDDFVNGIILEGIKSIIPTRQQIMTVLQPVIDILSVAFDSILTAFKYTFEALRTAALFLVRTVIPLFFYYLLYAFSFIADRLLFFLPFNRTLKMFLLLVLIIVLGVQSSSELQLAWFIIQELVNAAVSTVTRIIATGIDIVFNF